MDDAPWLNQGSLWAEYVNKNRCISVRLVSEEDISLIFYVKDGSSVYTTAQRQYTAVQKMRTHLK